MVAGTGEGRIDDETDDELELDEDDADDELELDEDDADDEPDEDDDELEDDDDDELEDDDDELEDDEDELEDDDGPGEQDEYEPGDVNRVGGSSSAAGDVNTIGARPGHSREAASSPERASTPESEISAEVLTYLARAMSDDPDAVVIRREERRGSTVLRLHVAPRDMGRIIGRRGRTAQAIRTLVGAARAREGVQAVVDIVDD